MQSPANTFFNRVSVLPWAHVSLVLIGMMWVYSFLNYYHLYPMTTFYQEWGTALLGVTAMFLLLGGEYWRKAEIPRIVLLPVGLMLLVVVQYGLGKMAYFGEMLIYALYLMWAAMLIMLGGRLRELLGLPAMATALAACLLLGAELNAFIGIHQHYHWHTFLEKFMMPKASSGGVYGNIAQQNHYADYLTLGLASLGMLYARGTLKAWLAALLALPILFVLPLTGSREIWVFLLWLAGLAFLWQRKDRSQRPLLYFSLLVLLGFGLMHGVIKLPGLALETDSVDTLQRMFSEEVGSGSVRVYLLKEAALIFSHFPLLGAGFGGYGYQHYLLGPELHNVAIVGLYNNAHNLVMHIAAEGGLAGLLILFGTLVPWLRRAWRAELTPYHWWGYGLLGVLGIHSMGEYPLWYAYFLGIAAILLGMLDTGRFRLEMGSVGKVFVLLTLLLGALSLQQLLAGYRNYETLNALGPEPGQADAYYEQMNSGIAEMWQQQLLRPYSDILTSRFIEVNADNLDGKLELNGRVQHFIPLGAASYHQAMLLALKGEEPGAEAEIELAIWAYPQDFEGYAIQLQGLAAKDPAHFAALLEFMLRKREEYIGAIHTK